MVFNDLKCKENNLKTEVKELFLSKEQNKVIINLFSIVCKTVNRTQKD